MLPTLSTRTLPPHSALTLYNVQARQASRLNYATMDDGGDDGGDGRDGRPSPGSVHATMDDGGDETNEHGAGADAAAAQKKARKVVNRNLT